MRKSKLTQSRAAKGCLHSVAISDTKSPHGNTAGSLFAFLDTKLAALKRKLRIKVKMSKCWYTGHNCI